MADPQRIPVPASGGVMLSTISRRAPMAPTTGTAIPFLLVHGLASNARMWDGVAEALAAQGHDSVALDLRGHGRSDKPDEGYDFSTMTADLLAVMQALGLERPIVAGQSWGGNVVMELAARHPARVRGVVAVDGGTIELAAAFPEWAACAEVLAPPRLTGTPLASIEAHLRAAHPDWPEGGIRGSLGNFEVRADGTVAPWLSRERHMTILAALWGHHPGAIYGSVAAPVLLLPAVGAHGDPGRSAAKRAEVAAAEGALPRSRTRWFEPADHDIHAQFPGQLADAMTEAVRDGFFAP